MSRKKRWLVGTVLVATVGLFATFVVNSSLFSGGGTDGWTEAAQRADPEGFVLHLERLLRRDQAALHALEREVEVLALDAPPASDGAGPQQSSTSQQAQRKGGIERRPDEKESEAALLSIRALLNDINKALQELDAQRQVVKGRITEVPSAKVVELVRTVLARSQFLFDQDPVRTLRHPRKVPAETK